MNVEYICDDNIGSIGPSASQLGGDATTHSDSMSLNEIMGTVGLSSPHGLGLGLGASPALVGTAHIFLSPCRSISGEEALGYTPPPKHRYSKDHSEYNRFMTIKCGPGSSSVDDPVSLDTSHHTLGGSPVRSRGCHDYSYYDDADSGICTSRLYSPVRGNRPRSAGATLSSPSPQLYKPATPYTTPVSSPSRAPSRAAPVDLEQALDSSESRRHLLTQKLIDAKDTIHQQAERLNNVSGAIKEKTSTVETLRQKERQYQRKIEELEMDRSDYQKMNLENMRHTEGLDEKLTSLDLEKRSVEASYKLLEMEAKKTQSDLKKSLSCVGLLKQEYHNVAKTKDSVMKEISALKESLAITRSRNESLENQSRDTKQELENLRQENWSLTKELKSLMKQLADVKKANVALMESQRALQNKVEDLAHERERLMKRVGLLEEGLRDAQSSCDQLATDKERFLQEAVKLTRQMQAMTFEADNLQRVKLALDDEVSQRNTELAQAKLEVDRKAEENRKLQDELAAVKKVSELLSLELLTVKQKADDLMRQSVSLEQTKKIAYQQHQLYEDEIHSLGAQLDKVRQSMESMNRDHLKEKDTLNSQLIKVKDELRKAKSERNELEKKCHDYERKLSQSALTLKDETASQQKELGCWKEACEKLTASVSHKEMEVITLTQKLEQLVHQHESVNIEYEKTKEQVEELSGTAEKLNKLQEDHRRLLQEKAENKQMIELLEVQKNVLSKTVEGNVARAQDISNLQYLMEQGKSTQLKLQENMHELEQVKNTLEREKANLKAEKERLLKSAEDVTERLETVQRDNGQLQSQVSQLTKENGRLKAEKEESVPQTVYDRLKEEKVKVNTSYKQLRQQFQELEESHHQLVTANYRKRKNDGETVLSLTQDKEDLDRRIAQLSGQVATLNSQNLSAEEQVAEVEYQVETLEQEALENSKTFASQVKTLQKQMDLLQLALEDSQTVQREQTATIQTLREEIDEEKTKKPSKIAKSLEDAGEELNQMRTELHKLVEVIQVKDHTIESLEEQLHSLKDVARYDEIDSPVKETTELKTTIAQLRETLENVSRKSGSDGPGCEQQDQLVAGLRRELRSKDRQIENLEEQLRRSTLIKIKKLKRDASKVELLKVENRRLHNQLHTPSSNRVETTGDDSTDSSTSAGPDNLEPSWVKTYTPLADSIHTKIDGNTHDPTSVKVEDSPSVPQNQDVGTPRSLQDDTNRSVTDISTEFESASRLLKSEEPTESKTEMTETHSSRALRSTSEEETWDTTRKTGRLSPVQSKGTPSDSLCMAGVRARGGRLRRDLSPLPRRNSLTSTVSPSQKLSSSYDDQLSSSSESIGSMLRSNARLLRSSDLLLSGRSSSLYSGSPMPFRQNKSFRPSSEFTSIPKKHSK